MMIRALSLLIFMFVCKVGYSENIDINSNDDWESYLEKVNNTIPEGDIIYIKPEVMINIRTDIVNNGKINVAGDVIFENASSLLNNGKINIAGSITLGKNSTCSNYGTINCKGSFTFEENALIVYDDSIFNRTESARISSFEANPNAVIKIH